MNTISQIGRLTRDPELRATANGKSVCLMRVAVERPKINGEDRGADYFTVVAWNGLGETCAKYLVKGREIGYTGRLAHREWDDDKGHHEAVEIVANTVDFLRAGKAEQPDPAPVGADGEPIPF